MAVPPPPGRHPTPRSRHRRDCRHSGNRWGRPALAVSGWRTRSIRRPRAAQMRRHALRVMASLRLVLFGRFELRRVSGAAVLLPRSRKQAQALLAYLACRPGQAHPRNKLTALLWPDVDDRQARASLRRPFPHSALTRPWAMPVGAARLPSTLGTVTAWPSLPGAWAGPCS